MKKVEITNDLFNTAMKAVEKTIGDDIARPVLTKCKIEVYPDTIKFISLDGYSGTIYTIKHQSEDVEEFSFLCDIFFIDVDKDKLNKISIEQVDNEIVFSYLDNDGARHQKKIFIDKNEYIDYKKIYENNKAQDSIDICFDVRLLKRVLNSYIKCNRVVKLTINTSKELAPMFISNEDEERGNIESIVLPIRTK